MCKKWKNTKRAILGGFVIGLGVAAPRVFAQGDNNNTRGSASVSPNTTAPSQDTVHDNSSSSASGDHSTVTKESGNGSGNTIRPDATLSPTTTVNPSLSTGDVLHLDHPLSGAGMDSGNLKGLMDDAEQQSEKSYTRNVDRNNLDNNRAIRMQIEPYLLNAGRPEDCAAYMKLATDTLALLQQNNNSDKVVEAIGLLQQMAAYDFDRGQSELLAERIAQNRKWDKEYTQILPLFIQPGTTSMRLTEIKTKALGEFQLQILQLLSRRQFLQAEIAIRAYKASFNQESAYTIDTNVGQQTAKSVLGDNTSDDASASAEVARKEMISSVIAGSDDMGMKLAQGGALTIDALETYCQEGMVRTQTHYDAILSAINQEQMTTALERLQELLVLNETAPQLIGLETSKRKVLLTVFKDTNKVPDLLHLKDYDSVEAAINNINKETNDYDSDQIMAAVKTARAESNNAFNASRLAMTENDKDRADHYLQLATDIWPANPRIDAMMNGVVDASQAAAKARDLFDQSYGKQDWRGIYDNRLELGLALQNDKDRSAKLKDVVERLSKVDLMIGQAMDYLQRDMPYVAWEMTQEAAKDSPDDQVVTKAQTQVAPHIGQYLEYLNKAQSAAKANQAAASLMYYLQAQKLYPASRDAQDGIQQSTKTLLQTHSA